LIVRSGIASIKYSSLLISYWSYKVAEVINKALSRDVKDRYKDGEDMLKAMERAV
jgi:hypothetical protein